MTLKPCCATGSLHTGTPTGRIDKVHDLDCYIADAPDGQSKGIIVIIPDAMGWTLPNNRILADEYAKRGFTVYLPEFMQGVCVPEDMMESMSALSKTGLWNQLYKVVHVGYMVRHFIPFLYYNRPGVAGPRVYKWIKDVKKTEAQTQGLEIGVAGFCWGGKFVTELCHNQIHGENGSRLIACGFVAHPSFLSYPDDIEKIQLPYSCAAAGDHDPQMSPAQAKQTEEILQAKSSTQKAEGIEHEFVLYPDAPHGFAVRADEDKQNEAEAGKQAEEQAVRWFSRWLVKPPPSGN